MGGETDLREGKKRACVPRAEGRGPGQEVGSTVPCQDGQTNRAGLETTTQDGDVAGAWSQRSQRPLGRGSQAPVQSGTLENNISNKAGPGTEGDGGGKDLKRGTG